MKNKEVFLCARCGATMSLPECKNCGFIVSQKGKVWQLTDTPDLVVEGDADKYIGYEYIGENYSGSRKYIMEDKDVAVAKEVARLTGDGVFLDLACGDGCFTVPTAALGTKVIAGDISNTMLAVLQKKAEYNGISLDDVMLCRMNALEIPLANESVDTVIANSVLHLISNPEKVLNEIYRVLKKGGCFICVDDVPGKDMSTVYDNSEYNGIVNSMYGGYWKKMESHGVLPKKYSWRFDRSGFCEELFAGKETISITRGQYYEIPLKDGFLPRFFSRGFSDQVMVPEEIHKKVMSELFAEFQERYGEHFDNIPFKGTEEDILLTVYRK